MKSNNDLVVKKFDPSEQDMFIRVNHKKYKVSDLINDFYDAKKLIEENHKLLLKLYNR